MGRNYEIAERICSALKKIVSVTKEEKQTKTDEGLEPGEHTGRRGTFKAQGVELKRYRRFREADALFGVSLSARVSAL